MLQKYITIHYTKVPITKGIHFSGLDIGLEALD